MKTYSQLVQQAVALIEKQVDVASIRGHASRRLINAVALKVLKEDNADPKFAKSLADGIDDMLLEKSMQK